MVRSRGSTYLLLLASLFLQACQFVAEQRVSSESITLRRPNILIILSDDQRFDTMDYMPRTVARIFKEGISFPNAYVTTSECCPSRSSILTGLYAHNHGVRTNEEPLMKETFVQRLKKSGYYTGQVGKYLNSWEGSARPEFDFWVAFGGGAHRYNDPRLNVIGTWKDHKGYITHILRDYALEFFERAARQETPFILLFAPNAPHFSTAGRSRENPNPPPDPAPGDETLYTNLPPHRPPSFNEADISDKPRWLMSLPPLGADEISKIDAYRLRQIQSLNSLDQAIESLLNALAKEGKLDDTLVIYLSDNGDSWGEHRRPSGKNAAYEESSHVPFAVRYPRLTGKPRVDSRLVDNIDIAPTIYELARIPVPDVDGRSLLPLFNRNKAGGTQPTEWRGELLIEGWPEGGRFARGKRAPFMAIHTIGYVYVETDGDRSELYDMTKDPYQLRNEVENPAYAPIVSDLKARLKRMRVAPVGASRR